MTDPVNDPVDVVGVMDLLPAPALHLFQGCSRVVEPPAVVPEDPARFVGHPCELRDVVGEVAEFGLAFPERLLELPAFGDLEGSTGRLLLVHPASSTKYRGS